MSVMEKPAAIRADEPARTWRARRDLHITALLCLLALLATAVLLWLRR
jgi:hypothetical protein